MSNKKKCFVIMPFSKAYSLTKEQWTEVFEHKIKSAVEESGFGYKCERYKLRRANITKDILQELNSAHLVIADLTGKNPNVLWELGVRHTLSKRTILIAQDKKFLPSDLKDYPIILYNYKQTPAEVDKFKEDIKKELEDIEADPEKPDNPVADFLELKNLNMLAFEKSANLKKLSALNSELSYNIEKADILLKQLNETREERNKGKNSRWFTSVRLANACLELFLATRYVSLPQELLESIDLVNQMIKLINRHLDARPEFGEKSERILIKELPSLKKDFVNLLVEIRQITLNYANDNYQEPKETVILLASPKHEKYLKQLG